MTMSYDPNSPGARALRKSVDEDRRTLAFMELKLNLPRRLAKAAPLTSKQRDELIALINGATECFCGDPRCEWPGRRETHRNSQ